MTKEVWTRKACEYFDCYNGKDVGRRVKGTKDSYEKCSSCKGTGYIEEWIDIATLLRQSINIGG